MTYAIKSMRALAVAVMNLANQRVSVKDKGAKGDGVTDDSAAINAAAAAYSMVSVTPGRYRYSAETTVDPAKLDLMAGATFVGCQSGQVDISVRDQYGRFIGLGGNYNETTNTAAPFTTGRLKPAPMSVESPVEGVDLLAHWYNDTGLECVRAAGGALGSTEWYLGKWNYSTNNQYGPYDPSRHPELGFYKGDDPTVLDWQCYWLREYGVKAVVLVGYDLNPDTWTNPNNRGYWLNQLFTKVPNFNGLGYVIHGPYQLDATMATKADFVARWNRIIDTYLAYPHFYTVNVDGGYYPCIYLWDAGVTRPGVFGSDAEFEQWLKDIATRFKNAGYAGLCVMARNGGYYTDAANYQAQYVRAFDGTGVIMFEASYAWSGASYGNPVDYDGFVSAYEATYNAKSNRIIPNVMTSRLSKYHPSAYATGGSTPEKFGTVLRKAASLARRNATIPPIVTIYNVAEWGEGGPGLQPDKQNGYGYLSQLRTVDTFSSEGATDLQSYSKQVNSGTGTAGNNIKPKAKTVKIWTTTAGGTTLNGAYVAYQGGTIAPGKDGQTIKLTNIGSYLIRLCDVSNYANSGLHLVAATIDLNAWCSVEFTYYDGRGWVQTGPVTVTLP